MPQLNARQYEKIYKDFGIDLNKLGCVMLDVDGDAIPAFPKDLEENLYFSYDPALFWINGFVGGMTPHVTLLYGLLHPAGEIKDKIFAVLEGWEMKTVKVKGISFFESNIENAPYYCIIAEIDITPELLEGHQRMQLLPHIDTFPEYKAHLTIAYVHKNEKVRNQVVAFYRSLVGKKLPVLGLNFGGNKE
jgi:hypothetical protein